MDSHGHSRFAVELNRLLEASSFTPEDVVLELNRRSFPVPIHTFSYWLQGYFLPSSESSFQIVSIIESIFGVSDNCLSDALLEDLSSGASFVPGEFTQVENIGTSLPVDRYFPNAADETTDWEANLIQKVIRDEVYLNADHTYARYKATILARVPSVPNPSFFFQVRQELPVMNGRGGDEYFYNLSGLRIVNQEVFEEDNGVICAVQFALPDDVVPGDLYNFSLSWDEKSSEPMGKICDRFTPWTLDFYSCKITFEGGVPAGLRYVISEIVGNSEKEISNNIPLIREGNSVSISMKNVGNVVGYFDVPPPAEYGNK